MAKKVFVPPSQATEWITITPHNTTDIVDDATNNPQGYQITSGLFVGTTGDIALVSSSGVAKTFKNIPAGAFVPCAVKRVNSTGTTATDILGLISAQ